MKITNWTVQPTAQKGQSLLVSQETRGPVCPEVSIQLPTDVANEIKRRWDLVAKIEDKPDWKIEASHEIAKRLANIA